MVRKRRTNRAILHERQPNKIFAFRFTRKDIIERPHPLVAKFEALTPAPPISAPREERIRAEYGRYLCVVKLLEGMARCVWKRAEWTHLDRQFGPEGACIRLGDNFSPERDELPSREKIKELQELLDIDIQPGWYLHEPENRA